MTTTASPPTRTIDPARWPDVARVPQRPVRAAVARRLARRAVTGLPLRVVLPDGTSWGAGGQDDPTLRLVRPDAFFQRLGAGALIGFGEAYQAGDWETDDLAGVLTVLASRLSTLIPAPLQRLRRAAVRRRPRREVNTIAGARQNIQRHYDLSNELFALFLDESLTYSSAHFAGEPAASDGEELADAQRRKIDRLLDVAKVRPGTRLLEIGTGWGELAIRAAGRGARVTTVTISGEQAELARRRMAAAGLSDAVEVRLQDYRQVEGEYDAIVSVEMIEAVGWQHWPEYFSTLDRLLAPGGRVGLQAITMPHDRMLATRDTYTWIVKYIFPGGHLPSLTAIHDQVGRTSLEITDQLAFGAHYAETLRRWRRAFLSKAEAVDRLGFDETFRRMWSLYLAYSEAGFRSGYLDVVQLGMEKA
ncbi:SAM-dependent methyltransferase [Nocardioides speluncae]|uniref:SAM-dependent methyltransferase n=1 Tax=Nocardioides speluncae TaxID=2670337 RepID=UPI000D6963B0|nr:cyclopropane-fatty-acyl-phospholipid synthase family protein [Nocardioides speluncae]